MLKGTGISDGIGLGKAIIFKSQKIKLEKNKIKDVTLEKEKFYKAIKEVEKEIEDLLEKISGTEKEIMQAYLLILQDPNLIQKTIEIIEKEKWDAAYATEIGFNEIIKEFEKVDDTYISERSKDIEDMKKKIIAKIIGKEEINLSKLPSNTILVAKELSTSDIAKLDFKNIEGIITEVGGMNSHMAIMARTHEIPSSVGVNKITQNIKQNDVVAINGKTGEIFVNPSKKEYKNLYKKFNVYEIFYFTICTICFSCTMILIVPFISVYTQGIKDANYIRYAFGYLIVISEYIWAIRLPYSSITLAAGHFKETRKGACVEALSNIIISIILVSKLGLIGVTIGTIIAMTIRTIEFVYHTNKFILKRNVFASISKILVVIMETIIIVIIANLIPKVENVSYFSWAINAIIVFIEASIIVIILNIIVYRNNIKMILDYLKNRNTIN